MCILYFHQQYTQRKLLLETLGKNPIRFKKNMGWIMEKIQLTFFSGIHISTQFRRWKRAKALPLINTSWKKKKNSPISVMGKATGRALWHKMNEQGRSHSDLPKDLRTYAGKRPSVRVPLGKAWGLAAASSGKIFLAQSHRFALYIFCFSILTCWLGSSVPYSQSTVYVLCILFEYSSAVECKLAFRKQVFI